MRVAHATDIHWFRPPSLLRLSPKRWLGTANLYLRGRRHHFQEAVQSSLVETMLEQDPDVALITGDLTAQALPEEFEEARRVLEPLLEQVPTFVIPGNHDVYTGGAHRERRIEHWFREWMHLVPGTLGVFRIPGLTIVGLDPNRAHWSASGVVPREQLDALAPTLEETPVEDALILALHYPVLHRDGRLYDGWEHGLRNASELVEVLKGARRRPSIIVHGHVHHGFTVGLDLGDATVPVHNPGSGGYAWQEDRDRAACFNVYTFDGPHLVAVERFRYGHEGFRPEPGGAYASGR